MAPASATYPADSFFFRAAFRLARADQFAVYFGCAGCGALELDSLDVLLVLNLLLDVLVALKQLVVLGLSELKPLIQVGLELLLERIHLVLLPLDELGLGGNDLLVAALHIRLALNGLQFLAGHLDLMCLLIPTQQR